VNLIGNAVKFTNEGSVRVQLRREGDKAVWTITDTGIGIRPENKELIFGPFNQEDASTARKYGGSGLGLTISRALVEQMGGELKVHSTPEVGSVFEFSVRVIKTGSVTSASPK
jgi:signal transduction histidine kinase